MPEHRRVLEPQDRDLHDAGQSVHAALRLLRRAQGTPGADRLRRAAAGGLGGGELGLQHAVVTSVNRDDDNGGGARAFVMVIEEIRRQAPGCRVEVLMPDFQGREEAMRMVVEARPEVLNHNIETVPRLYRAVRARRRAMSGRCSCWKRRSELRPGDRDQDGHDGGHG